MISSKCITCSNIVILSNAVMLTSALNCLHSDTDKECLFRIVIDKIRRRIYYENMCSCWGCVKNSLGSDFHWNEEMNNMGCFIKKVWGCTENSECMKIKDLFNAPNIY